MSPSKCKLINCFDSRFGNSVASLGDLDRDGFEGFCFIFIYCYLNSLPKVIYILKFNFPGCLCRSCCWRPLPRRRCSLHLSRIGRWHHSKTFPTNTSRTITGQPVTCQLTNGNIWLFHIRGQRHGR